MELKQYLGHQESQHADLTFADAKCQHIKDAGQGFFTHQSRAFLPKSFDLFLTLIYIYNK